MRAVIQRVNYAAVEIVDGAGAGDVNSTDAASSYISGEISEPGLLVLVGATHEDGPEQVETIARKICELRILEGEKSALDLNAPVLIVSQFTLYADVRKGRRPSWNQAAPSDVAKPLVDQVIAAVKARGLRVESGEFGAHMRVRLENDGPMTILVEA